MPNVTRLSPLNNTYGLPPTTWLSDEMIINSMPVFEIIPCKPHFESGLNLFSVHEDTQAYLDILGKHGYSTSTPIRLAFIADNFPTDSFTNDYGETFLQKFTDVASQGMSQLAQMTGAETGTDAIRKIGQFTSGIGNDMEGTLGSILKTGGGGMQNIANSLNQFKQSLQNQSGAGGLIGGGVGVVDKMLAGHRVDFPQVWRNSGFTPSYTATIRLYNPNPASDSSTEKHIIGPLAVILCLALPRSDDGRTYNWPFFHKIKATGIYGLDPAVITNVTVIKGGDQQQIAYNQRLGIVDVRIDFTSLYNSILQEEGSNTLTNRPTLRSYLKSMKDTDRSLSTSRETMRSVIGPLAGANTLLEAQIERQSPQQRAAIARNEAVQRRETPEVQVASADSRVDPATSNLQQQLEEQRQVG